MPVIIQCLAIVADLCVVGASADINVGSDTIVTGAEITLTEGMVSNITSSDFLSPITAGVTSICRRGNCIRYKAFAYPNAGRCRYQIVYYYRGDRYFRRIDLTPNIGIDIATLASRVRLRLGRASEFVALENMISSAIVPADLASPTATARLCANATARSSLMPMMRWAATRCASCRSAQGWPPSTAVSEFDGPHS